MLQNKQTHNSPSSSINADSASISSRRGIDPMTLVTLNYGLFRSLYAMGTSREQICAAMLLNADEFDYILGLMNSQKFKSDLIGKRSLSG
jgi:hypothetical protein